MKSQHGMDFLAPPKELHTFTDASEVAYGLAAYFDFRDSNSKIRYSLGIGNSRLSAVKEVASTILKLELQAMVISTRIKHRIFADAETNVENIFL